ncbi:Asp23/Gls24 family envelope stress response protein [Amycolatopsis sp. NPDC004625]|uniref:Asp23/Gls24 family envelope stress response protein n=1 Tax=Amycolatopsis sp. NPDC004625 TaxID=3154670 RepID=UPI0033BF81CD
MTTVTATAPAPSDVGERGALTIGDTAVERIATTAVTEVDGIGGTAARVLGVAVGSEDPDRSAKVTATVAGDTASLTVRLSISYPQSVLQTTDAVREHLIRRVHELTGLAVERVDITVTALYSAHAATRRVQ